MRNAYLRDFRAQLRTRFAEDSVNMPMSEWIEKNTTLRKRPFRFEGYEFQRQIVDDMHPRMYVIKCSQIGLTETQLRKFAAFLTRHIGVNAIFTLPDDNMFKRVSQTRFKPMIETDGVFNLTSSVETKPIRSIPLYQIGQSFGYFVGNKESDATSINADLLFHDELDLSDQEMIALFQSRLQGSDYRITQNFSTPTYEGFGIDAGFRISDQHEYMCKCPHCSHYNIPTYTPEHVVIPGLSSDINDFVQDIDDEVFETLDLANAYVMCERCHKPLDMKDPTLREWVPRYAGRRNRGYRVSPFCTPRLTVEYITEQLVNYKRKDALRRFHNTVLGEAFNDSNARLSELEIRAIMDSAGEPDIDRWTPVGVGIDVGQVCHITLFNLEPALPVAFAWRQVAADNLVDEVKRLMETYNIVCGGIDRQPYEPTSNEVRDISNGIIVPLEYSRQATAPAVQIVKDELDNISHIKINRTTAVDQLVTAIRKRQVRLMGYGQYDSLLVSHLRDMVRVENEDTPAIWQKLTGEDHFFHSAIFGYFAVRVNAALDYRSGMEQRLLMPTSGLTVSVQTGSDLSMKSRRSETMSLASL